MAGRQERPHRGGRLKHSEPGQLAGGLLDLLLPPECTICGELLESPSGPVCPACQAGFEPVAEPICPACGQAVDGLGLCRTCRESPGLLGRIRSGFHLGGPLQEGIWRMKRAGQAALADHFGELLASRTIPGWDWTRIDLVVPVPLHRTRLRQRGFNQSVQLARCLCERHAKPLILDGLIRRRETPSQSASPGRARRFHNMYAAFETTKRHPFTGKRIALVDDVVTTGATLQACARALLGAGASSVFALTLARTPL